MRSTRLRVLVSVLVALATACSFSHSSESSSDSSSSSSESSESGPWFTPRTQYERDLGTLTSSYARAGRDDFPAFQKEVAALAARNGVMQWERDESTWLGIGYGLGRAGLSRDALRQIERDWTDAQSDRIAWLEAGYQGASLGPAPLERP